jgi:hypothetical protein
MPSDGRGSIAGTGATDAGTETMCFCQQHAARTNSAPGNGTAAEVLQYWSWPAGCSARYCGVG